MLTADVRFEGWTADDWSRFLNLWKPRAARSYEHEPTRPRGGLFVIHDGGRVRKLLHTRRGRLEPRAKSGPLVLAELAREHQASWALAAHFGALDEIMERFGARARRGDDITTQSLDLLAIVREMMSEGAIEAWPHRLRGVPPPTPAMVHKTVDTLCADGRCVALGMFKDEELHTAFVARRRGNAFDVIAGPDELRPAMGLLSGDWRRDYRHLARAIEERYAPLGFGCFAELDAFRELQTDGRPGAWARAVALRDVVLSPIPLAIGLALGVDGARYAYQSAVQMTGRLAPAVVPSAALEPLIALVDGVRKRVAAAAGKDVPGSLGFDPMAALRALLRR